MKKKSHLIIEGTDPIVVQFVFYAFFHHFTEIFVGVGLIMFEHEKSGQVSRITIDGQICPLDPMVEIIVFTAPTIKDVGEPVDFLDEDNIFLKLFKIN